MFDEDGQRLFSLVTTPTPGRQRVVFRQRFDVEADPVKQTVLKQGLKRPRIGTPRVKSREEPPSSHLPESIRKRAGGRLHERLSP